MSSKTELFTTELNLIQDEAIRGIAIQALEIVPDYFFTMASSTTGKYHPSYALGEGGLVRHVRACMRIAYELYRIENWEFTNEQKDLMLVALLVHDGWKQGYPDNSSGFTTTQHPLIASREIFNHFLDLIPFKQLEFICKGIETHMGQWIYEGRTDKKVLKKPRTKYQKFIHLVDYLASRRCIEINFDATLSTS